MNLGWFDPHDLIVLEVSIIGERALVTYIEAGELATDTTVDLRRYKCLRRQIDVDPLTRLPRIRAVYQEAQ